MKDDSIYFVTKSLDLLPARSILMNRLNYSTFADEIKPKIQGIRIEKQAERYPKSDNAKLEFNRFYKPDDMANNNTINFYSPYYRIKESHSDGVILPSIKFFWKGGSVVSEDEELEVAILQVNIEQCMSRKVKKETRIIEHNVSIDFSFYTLDEQGIPQNHVVIPFDQIAEQPNKGYIASMSIKGMKNLSLIVTAMNKKECTSKIRLHATADMYVPKVQSLVDLNSFNNFSFHKAMLDKGIIADSIMNNSKTLNVRTSPFKKETQTLKLAANSSSDNRMIDTISRDGRVLTHTSRTPVHPRITTLQPRFETMSLPIPTLRPAIMIGNLETNRAIIGNFSVLRERLPSVSKHNSALMNATTIKRELSKSVIKNKLKESTLEVNGRKAISMTILKQHNLKKIYTIQELSATAQFASFFSILNFGQVFSDIPDHIMDSIREIKDPTVLIKYNVFVNRVPKTVYQDPIQTNLFYYMPEVFKLGRADNPPFEPLIRLDFKELLLEKETEDEVDLSYRVEITFTALPYIERKFYAAVQSDPKLKQAAGDNEVSLSPLTPPLLTLDLNQFAQKYNADILQQITSLTSGVTVTCELGASDFDSLFAALINDRGVPSIQGKLLAEMSNQNIVDIGMSISLFNTVGSFFSQSFYNKPEDPEGVYRVLLKNEIESFVSVKNSHVWLTSDNSNAKGSINPIDTRFNVAPGESKEIKIVINPKDAIIHDIEIETKCVVELNIDAIWKQITINHGFSSYAFEISITAEEPELFGTSPGEGIPNLTALKVEFENGPEITLTKEEQEITATLYKSLLADLQDKPMTETYRYRVINIHGNEECARSNWITSTGNLRISPVYPGE